jgi:hypothetical protein
VYLPFFIVEPVLYVWFSVGSFFLVLWVCDNSVEVRVAFVHLTGGRRHLKYPEFTRLYDDSIDVVSWML